MVFAWSSFYFQRRDFLHLHQINSEDHSKDLHLNPNKKLAQSVGEGASVLHYNSTFE